MERQVQRDWDTLGYVSLATEERGGRFFAMAAAVATSKPPELKKSVVLVVDVEKARGLGVCFTRTDKLKVKHWGLEYTTMDTVPLEAIVRTIEMREGGK